MSTENYTLEELNILYDARYRAYKSGGYESTLYWILFHVECEYDNNLVKYTGREVRFTKDATAYEFKE